MDCGQSGDWRRGCFQYVNTCLGFSLSYMSWHAKTFRSAKTPTNLEEVECLDTFDIAASPPNGRVRREELATLERRRRTTEF